MLEVNHMNIQYTPFIGFRLLVRQNVSVVHIQFHTVIGGVCVISTKETYTSWLKDHFDAQIFVLTVQVNNNNLLHIEVHAINSVINNLMSY